MLFFFLPPFFLRLRSYPPAHTLSFLPRFLILITNNSLSLNGMKMLVGIDSCVQYIYLHIYIYIVVNIPHFALCNYVVKSHNLLSTLRNTHYAGRESIRAITLFLPFRRTDFSTIRIRSTLSRFYDVHTLSTHKPFPDRSRTQYYKSRP